MFDHCRLIEVHFFIKEIGREVSGEKSIRQEHFSALHLWSVRRSLVVCRATIHGALVPVGRGGKDVSLKASPADAAKTETMSDRTRRRFNRRPRRKSVAEQQLRRSPRNGFDPGGVHRA